MTARNELLACALLASCTRSPSIIADDGSTASLPFALDAKGTTTDAAQLDAAVASDAETDACVPGDTNHEEGAVLVRRDPDVSALRKRRERRPT